MKGVFKAEFFKMSRSKLLWFLTLGNLAFLLLLLVENEVESSGIVQFLTNSDFFASASVMAALYGVVIANEYVSGYFKEAIFAGYTRRQVYSARYLAFSVGMVVILMLPYLLSLLFFFVQDGSGTTVFTVNGESFLTGWGLLFLYCFCFSAFFMMTTVIMKSYASIVFICIVYNMAAVFAHEIIPADALPIWLSYSFIGVTNKLLNIVREPGESIKVAAALLGQTILYAGIGYLFFTKEELR